MCVLTFADVAPPTSSRASLFSAQVLLDDKAPRMVLCGAMDCFLQVSELKGVGRASRRVLSPPFRCFRCVLACRGGAGGGLIHIWLRLGEGAPLGGGGASSNVFL